MQSREPSQSVQPIGGDHRDWPSRSPSRHAPYGLSLSAGELISRAWTLWKDDAPRLVGITAIPYVLMAVVGGLLGVGAVASGFDIESLDDSGPLVGLAIGGGIGFLISVSLMFIAAAAGTFLVVEERLRGEPRSLTALGALLSGLSFLAPMMGAYLLFGAAMTVAMAPVGILGVVAIASESFVAGGAALLLVFPVCLVLFVASMRLFAIGPVIVVEELGAVASIRRSLELTRGNVGDIFVAMLVFGAIMLGINMLTTVLGLIPIVGIVVQLVFGIVLASLQSVYIFLVYGALRDKQG